MSLSSEITKNENTASASANLPVADLARAANEARGLAMDAIAACKSGHLGLPLGSAEIGAVLFGGALNIAPAAPKWLNRDRFVLSGGHGSMFLYAWLNLAGFDLPLDELKRFRQLHSKTPGHPEFGETVGVEATTGPLGQGTGNIVGMAVAAKMAAARFNTPEHAIFDYAVVGLAGDGCLQEGISHEAASFAGRFGLDNLILFYDSNDVTLDAPAAATQNEDTAGRYRALGWDVVTVDGHDIAAVAGAYAAARADRNGRPKLIVAKTVIGRGIPEVQGKSAAHGEGGVKFVEAARKGLGLPEERFYVSPATREFFAGVTARREAAFAAWQRKFEAWKAAAPEKAALLESASAHNGAAGDVLAAIPEFPAGNTLASRLSGEIALNAVAKARPLVISGSADLHGSTKNYIKDGGDFDPAAGNCAGRNLHFGIREHAMGAILNGIAYDGIFTASGATFLTFSDYLRPSIRIAALAKLPVFYIFTHDSVGVGEDGPTHQPVETVGALRVIPNLDVFRPADAEETAAAYAHAVTRADGPVALILSRQNLPALDAIPVATRRAGALRGGYIARKETAPLTTILLATGSELALALEAAADLAAAGDNGVRVVSLPCFELFDRQPADYRDSVLPPAVTRRVSIEAGRTGLWWKYTGLNGAVIGNDTFGLSAPGPIAFRETGITKDALLNAVRNL
ncbi:MAG: transketolase [Puniceicoccales bacterium]|jgi:transketolase|nr:transketolase [Puniceicoccales bacterium]